MRTNIEIDDKLMDFVMSTGDFKTKREAVEEGLRLIKRRKAYDALLAAQGTLHWDDSEAHWAKVRVGHAPAETAVHELVAPYAEAIKTPITPTRKPRTAPVSAKSVTKRATA